MSLERIAHFARELRECAYEYVSKFEEHKKTCKHEDRHVRAETWARTAKIINERRRRAEDELDKLLGIK